MKPADYNYATFPSEDDVEFFATFFERLKPGEKAPDPELHELDGAESVPLSTIIRQHAFTVIELGSLT